MVGKLAVSLAGHDKGSIFLVIREDGDVIWLADGISRLPAIIFSCARPFPTTMRTC